MVTPRKVHEGVCTVCKLIIKKGEARIINSLTGQKKNLSSLLNTYGGIDIVEGVMCRKCERRLIALDASVLEFKKMCQTDLHMLNSKRGLTDITNTQENKKRNSSKKLFSVTEQSEEKDSYSNLSVDEGFVSVSQSDSSSSVYNIGFKTPVLIRKKEVTTSTPIKCLSSPVTITTVSPIPASDNTCINTTSCSVNNDHAYTCSKENSKKTPVHKAKLREQNDSNVLGEYIKKSEVDDFMTDNEFSDILGQLPQRSRQNFISCLLKHDHIKAAIEDTLLAGVAKSCDFLKNRKHGKLSVLMRKDWVALKNFNWGMILEELKTENPFLLRTFLSVLVPDSLNEEQKSRKAAENLPRLGMAYAILSQGRNSSLSRVQRVISTVLFDHICDQKVIFHTQITSMGLNVRKSVPIGLRTTKAQISLCIRAV